MSAGDYNVAVHLSLVENVGKGLLGLAGRFTVLNKSADIFNAKMIALKSQIALGGMMIGGGAAIAAPIIYAVTQAAKLQQQLSFVQEKTKSSTEEMNRFRGAVEDIAGITGFTSTQVATASKTLSLGLNASLDQIRDVLPLFSEFAAVQLRMKNTPIQTSVSQALQLVHLTGGKTDKESIQKNLDLLSKVSLIMPGNISKVLSAEKYAQGTLGNLFHVSTEQSLLFFASLQRMGIEGTRAGSQLLQAINRSMGKGILWAGLSIGGKSASGTQLEKIGLTKNNVPQFFDKNGQFNTEKWLGILNAFVKKEYATKPSAVASGEIATMFAQTLATTGTRIAAATSTDEGRRQLDEQQKSFQSAPALSEQFKQLQNLLGMQTTRVLSNFTSLIAELGYDLLPDATNIMGAFADKIHDFTLYAHSHQELVAFFEKALLAVAGLSIVGGTLLIVRAGLMGLLIPLQLLKLGIIGVETASIPALVVFGGIGIAIAAVGYGAYKLWQTLKTIDWHELGQEFSYLWKVIKSEFVLFFDWIKSKIEFWKPAASVDNNSVNSGFIHKTIANTINPISSGNNNNRGKNITQNKNQPLHAHFYLNTSKFASAMIDDIYNQATKVPNSPSQFDSNLSPMPSVFNSIGLG